ncbi:MAG: hypothetical protein ACJ8AI_35175 [Rhodopila sp.]
MTVLVPDMVFEQVREIAADPKERADLSILLSRADAADTSANLFAALPGTIRLRSGRTPMSSWFGKVNCLRL